jgi:hypothetical protein
VLTSCVRPASRQPSFYAGPPGCQPTACAEENIGRRPEGLPGAYAGAPWSSASSRAISECVDAAEQRLPGLLTPLRPRLTAWLDRRRRLDRRMQKRTGGGRTGLYTGVRPVSSAFSAWQYVRCGVAPVVRCRPIRRRS